MNSEVSEDAIIIPVAGGKGGVGKSLLTANLAIALAQAGQTTIAVDLDMGGSNLHSFLGLSNRHAGIGDFLLDRCGPLEDLVVPTATPQLGFLAGDGRNPFMANMTWAHKMRIMRALERLPARYILVDLGAGSSYNTLDFFSLAPRGLVVSTPELPAIMNLMAFLKNWILRSIAREVNRNEPLKKVVQGARNQPMRGPAWTIDDLVSQIGDVSPEYGEKIRGLCRQFRPRLVFNMVEHPDELELLKNVEQSLEKRLSLNVDFFGCLFRDPIARRLAGRGSPLLPSATESVLAEGIVLLADRLIRLWESPISDSRLRLIRSTEKEYRGRHADEDVNASEPASA